MIIIMYPRPHLYTSFFHVSMTPFMSKMMWERGYIITAPYRQFLVALVFADLPSIHPFFHEMTTLGAVKLERQGALRTHAH